MEWNQYIDRPKHNNEHLQHPQMEWNAIWKINVFACGFHDERKTSCHYAPPPFYRYKNRINNIKSHTGNMYSKCKLRTQQVFGIVSWLETPGLLKPEYRLQSPGELSKHTGFLASRSRLGCTGSGPGVGKETSS